MATLSRPVAATRVAVRRALTSLAATGTGSATGTGTPAGSATGTPAGSATGTAAPAAGPAGAAGGAGRPPVLVACSGGADSMALAAATGFVAARLGIPAGLVSIDHQLQAGSAQRAADVARWASGQGFDPVEVVAVRVDGRTGGPEAAARGARYEALAAVAARHHAAAVLLGHTRDDQAETVLLALARGSGPRGLAGMPYRRDIDGVPFLRPFLGISRADTRAACLDQGLAPWQDPHNTDPAYARARVRTVLPLLIDALGPDLVDNLARTAKLLGEDAAVLDDLAAGAARAATAPDGRLLVAELTALPAALRTRVLREFALRAGVPPGLLAYRHVAALDALVTSWHGQKAVALPGGVRVARGGDGLRVLSAGTDAAGRAGGIDGRAGRAGRAGRPGV